MTPSTRQIVARFSVIKPLYWLLKHNTCMRYAQFGVIGFDYVQLEAVMRLEAIPRSERPTLFERIKAFEAGMLKGFAEKQAVKTRQAGR